jgi:hypothetical protein
MRYVVVVLPAELGDEMRVITNRPLPGFRRTGKWANMRLSSEDEPARLRRQHAERWARRVPAGFGRPLVMSESDWAAPKLPL